MIQVTNKQDCCGCSACFNSCPKNAIAMLTDIEGYLYPAIDKSACINCGRCEHVCPVLNPNRPKSLQSAYILRNKNTIVVENSTSGGAFTLFSEFLLGKGAVVYGAGYDTDMKVICKAATCKEDLIEMRGSKFVQSDLSTCFQDIRSLLKTNQIVLFTGTPCQVAGLISFLGEKPDNLICIDFVCRGVPSPGLWANYVKMMEQKHHSKITGVRFKNKTYGYHASTMRVDFSNGSSWYGSGRVDPMMKAFVNELASRPSCHTCAFKGVDRPSDITMFDCYEFSKIIGVADDDKGYSSILVHTKKGQELINAVENEAIIYRVEAEKLIDLNGIMVYNSSKPNPRRDELYQLAAKMPIDQAMQLISPITKRDKAVEGLKGFLFKTGLIRLLSSIRKKRTVEIQ